MARVRVNKLYLMVYMYCLSIERRILDKILYVIVCSLIYNTISVIPVLVLTKLWALTGIYIYFM